MEAVVLWSYICDRTLNPVNLPLNDNNILKCCRSLEKSLLQYHSMSTIHDSNTLNHVDLMHAIMLKLKLYKVSNETLAPFLKDLKFGACKKPVRFLV